MARKSSIHILDPRLKAAIDDAITQGRATIDDIVRMVRDLGGDVSRSTVGRYKKTMDERLAEFRESQAVAGEWVRQLKADPEGDIGQMLAQLLKVVAHQTGVRMLDDGADPKQIAEMARAIRDLTSVEKLKIELEAKARATALADAASKAEQSGREAGLSDATIEAIKRNILGVKA